MFRRFMLMCGLAVTGLILAGCGGSTSQPADATGTSAGDRGPAAGNATVLGDLLKDWQDQKDTMLKIADAMPEDKFGYKSTPPQRSYGEQVMHIALVNVDLLKLVGGTAPAPTFTAESVKTKADMLKALAESYDYGTALLQAQTDATSERRPTPASSGHPHARASSGSCSATRWMSTDRWSSISG